MRSARTTTMYTQRRSISPQSIASKTLRDTCPRTFSLISSARPTFTTTTYSPQPDSCTNLVFHSIISTRIAPKGLADAISVAESDHLGHERDRNIIHRENHRGRDLIEILFAERLRPSLSEGRFPHYLGKPPVFGWFPLARSRVGCGVVNLVPPFPCRLLKPD